MRPDRRVCSATAACESNATAHLPPFATNRGRSCLHKCATSGAGDAAALVVAGGSIACAYCGTRGARSGIAK